MLSAAEVTAARDLLVTAGELPDGAAIAHIVLDEPHKDALAAWKAGDPIDRRVRALVVPGPELTMVELVVSLTRGEIDERVVVEGMRPSLLFGESFMAIVACQGSDEYIAALARRGITDID